MKRFLAPLLAVFAVFSLSVTAEAYKLKTSEVSWVQSVLTKPGGVADSITARSVRSATAHDTTQAIDIRDFIVPGMEFADGAATVDSISFLRIDYYPVASSPTVAADSVFFSIQVSNDGVLSWVTCTGTNNFVTTGDSPLSDTPGMIRLEQGSTNAFYLTLSQISQLGKAFVGHGSSATAPTTQHLFGWPYMRVIVQGDQTGRYDMKVTGFVDER